MGIFNSKHDDAQTITPNSDVATADASSVTTPTDTASAAVTSSSATSTSAQVDEKSTKENETDSFLTTNEPVSTPVVETTETVTSAPEVPSTTDTTSTTTTESTPVVETTEVEPVVIPEPSTSNTTPVVNSISVKDDSGSEDLSDIKEEALKQLSPLINKLDQTPEEKFHTAMMMVQSTDDKSLIKMAYEAAQAITDEKEKAQALLDIVNEINYFTQQSNPEVN